MIATLLAFLGVSALVIVTPGQDTALTIRNTLAGGRRAGVLTALGVSTGQAVWAVAASFGLAALVAASEPVFLAIRVIGAVYLVALGIQSLLAALRRRDGSPGSSHDGSEPGNRRRPYGQGVVSNLGNPKMALFFTSLLPQFATSTAGLLLLGLVFSSLTLAWLGLYAVAVARAAGLFGRPRIRRALDAVLGTVLIGLGARLATR